MKVLTNPVIFSLKPYYAKLVFEGIKKIELRRRISAIEEQNVLIYVSSPEKTLRGGFRVGHIWKGSPQEIWDKVFNLARITKKDFDAYYEGSNIAYALEIVDVWEYKNPASLAILRRRFPNFVVPQSWRYITCNEHNSFQRMKRKSDNISTSSRVA